MLQKFRKKGLNIQLLTETCWIYCTRIQYKSPKKKRPKIPYKKHRCRDLYDKVQRIQAEIVTESTNKTVETSRKEWVNMKLDDCGDSLIFSWCAAHSVYYIVWSATMNLPGGKLHRVVWVTLISNQPQR